MKGNIYKILNDFGEQSIPATLYNDIVVKIEKAKIKKARINLLFQGTLSVLSFVAIFPVFINVVKGFSQSGFFSYLSLIFTDSEVIFFNWKVFATSLLESTPFYEVMIFLVVIFVLLESIKFAFNNLKMVQYHIYQPN